MKLGEIGDLPTTLSTEQAADLWGCGPDHLWALARSGEAPVAPLRLGRKLRWPTVLVLASIGVDSRTDTKSTTDTVVPITGRSAG